LRKQLAAIIVAGVVLAAPGVLGQQPESTFLLHINQQIDPASLVVSFFRYFPEGGGYSNFGDRLPHLKMQGPQDVVIDTVLATALRVIVFYSGYQFVFLDVPSLAESRKKTIDLIPLSMLTLRGRVAQSSGGRVEISYDMSQLAMHYFFQAPYGSKIGGSGGSFPSSPIPVAQTTITPDGSFAVAIPDFLSDPLVAQSGLIGEFTFFERTGPTKGYSLSVTGTPGRMWKGLVPMKSYPAEIVLNREAR
jgi:hypothetical protein